MVSQSLWLLSRRIGLCCVLVTLSLQACRVDNPNGTSRSSEVRAGGAKKQSAQMVRNPPIAAESPNVGREEVVDAGSLLELMPANTAEAAIRYREELTDVEVLRTETWETCASLPPETVDLLLAGLGDQHSDSSLSMSGPPWPVVLLLRTRSGNLLAHPTDGGAGLYFNAEQPTSFTLDSGSKSEVHISFEFEEALTRILGPPIGKRYEVARRPRSSKKRVVVESLKVTKAYPCR